MTSDARPGLASAGGPGTLGATFDPRLNGLNALRLALALGVVLRHSFTMLGEDVGWPPAEVLMRSVFVDGFFAVSGFLIVRSWVANPHWRRFLRARFLRIMPGFWVCLVVVGLVAAPLHALLTGAGVTGPLLADGARYVVRNAFLWVVQEDVAGGPLGAAPAEAATWNGSLWTLAWEFACYLGVLALGITGLLVRRWVLPAAFLVSLGVLALTTVPALDVWFVHHGARFATMFLAGALVHQHRDRLPARWWLVGLAVAVVVAAAHLPDYRTVGALPLAYACVVGGALLRVPALRLPDDLSYGTYIYAFPVQQLVVGAGGATLGVARYFLVSSVLTLPLAALSWFLVERPALRRKGTPVRAGTGTGRVPGAAAAGILTGSSAGPSRDTGGVASAGPGQKEIL